MGERAINPILNVHDKYRKVNIINSYWVVVDPLNNIYTPTGNELWSNVANWSLGHIPTATETATISGGNITLDITTTINKLNTSSGRTLSANGNFTLTVNNDVNSLGLINFTGTSAGLTLKGAVNNVASYSGGTGTVIYDRVATQAVFSGGYYDLTFGGGTKTISANLTTARDLRVGNSLQFGAYTVTIGGRLLPSDASATLNGTGSIITIGRIETAIGRGINITGGASLEIRGGVYANNGNIFTNTSPVSFTTNNQTVSRNVSSFFAGNVTIVGAITITNTGFLGVSTINGTVSGSTLINNGTLEQYTGASLMVTGTYSNGVNAINSYSFAGAFTLPFTSYMGLSLSGSGIKSAAGNLTLATSLSISGTAKLELGSYNLSVGTTTVVSATNSALMKSGGGSVLFIGEVSILSNASITLSAATTTIETRGGVNFQNGTFNQGANILKATTNNQNYRAATTNNVNSLLIDGITVTIPVTNYLVLAETVNGTGASPKLDNRGTCEYRGATEMMATGVLECNLAVNTLIYSGTNQDVKAGTYRNLTLNTGGVKKLLGNVSVVNTYTLTAPATLDSNGFALSNP